MNRAKRKLAFPKTGAACGLQGEAARNRIEKETQHFKGSFRYEFWRYGGHTTYIRGTYCLTSLHWWNIRLPCASANLTVGSVAYKNPYIQKPTPEILLKTKEDKAKGGPRQVPPPISAVWLIMARPEALQAPRTDLGLATHRSAGEYSCWSLNNPGSHEKGSPFRDMIDFGGSR